MLIKIRDITRIDFGSSKKLAVLKKKITFKKAAYEKQKQQPINKI